MESNISNAFLLLAIGMVTVFIVLLLVVLCGSLLIKLVNKYAPEPIKKVKLIKPLISNKEIAVMTAVVDHITLGKGKIESIEKF
jgi:oxaloacetate decarboxylase gamma subunit